jgi:hypothetical protein
MNLIGYDLRFSRRWLWRWLSSGLYHRVDWYEFTKVWGILPSIQDDRPDDGGSTEVRNVGKLILVYTALQPRRQPSSYEFNRFRMPFTSYMRSFRARFGFSFVLFITDANDLCSCCALKQEECWRLLRFKLHGWSCSPTSLRFKQVHLGDEDGSTFYELRELVMLLSYRFRFQFLPRKEPGMFMWTKCLVHEQLLRAPRSNHSGMLPHTENIMSGLVLDSSSSRVFLFIVRVTWTFCLFFKISIHWRRLLCFYSSGSRLEDRCVLSN